MNTLRRVLRSIVLPREISSFEAEYLKRMNRIGLIFFALHIPAIAVLAWCNGTGALLALALTAAVVAGPGLAYVTLRNPRAVSMTYGVAAMFVGGLLVHFGQGPVQIEMHFYFFALIAMLAVFGNPLVILAAALTVALHHLILWFIVPSSVFNYDAPVWVVAVHAAFVVLESIAACFIARSFFDNVIGLEKIVRARTGELDARNRDMRLVLDNVAQGLATIDRAGVLSAERSRVIEAWLGVAEPGQTMFDLFERAAPDFAETSRVGWEQVAEGFLPTEVALEQMPAEIAIGGQHFRLVYLPIAEREDQFLVVMTDVTAAVNEQRAERDRIETMALFERLIADRNAVNDFFDEGNQLVDVVTGETPTMVVAQRVLHTLKGNSAIFGLRSLSTLCHELESRIADEGTLPTSDERTQLRDRWATIRAGAERWLGARRRVIEMDTGVHAKLEQAIRNRAPLPTLLSMVHDLELEPTSRRLEHFGEQATRIAGRLDKQIDVKIIDHGVRIDPKAWMGFWSVFIHAVRNAIDHGIETPEERAAAGKPERGLIELETVMQGDRLEVSISDDGRGIDWNALRARALQFGLAATTESDLHEALFSDGVSTAQRITDISGRGLGMGALREATLALGGRIETVAREQGGTTLRMIFPKASASPDRGNIAASA